MKGKTISGIMLLLLFVGVLTLPLQIEGELYDGLIPVSSGNSVTVYERTSGWRNHTFSVAILMGAGGTFITNAREYYNVTSDGTYLKIHCFRDDWRSGHGVGNNIAAVKLNGVPGFPEGLWASIIVDYTLGYNGIAESRFNALGPDTQIGPYGSSLCTYMGDQHSDLVLGFTRPHITVLSPQNKPYATTSISLTFIVNETASWIGYSLDGQANVTITGNSTLTSLFEGPHHVVVYANSSTCTMWASNTVYFTVDLTSPTVSVLSPENKTYAVAGVPLIFTVSEPISWIGYSLDDRTNVTISGKTTLTGLTYESHSLTVYANDTAGNTGASNKVYFTVIPDTTPPMVSVLSPENITYVATSIPLIFSVSEPTSWIGYSLDDQANVTVSGSTTLAGLTEGSHSVVVYARDVAGNVGVSDKVFFTVELPVGGLCAISIEPSKTIVALGQIVTAKVAITNITDCAGYQLWIDYDSTVLEMISWTFDTDPANPLSPTQMAPSAVQRIDTNASVPGIVKLAVVWKAGVSSYSGSGVAAEITFQALLAGNSTLVFDQYWTKAVNYLGEEILFGRFDNPAWVFITLPGDVDGDKDVDVGDQRKVQLAMFSVPSAPNWDPNMDIDSDLDVDVGDMRKQQLHMFESW